jgi:hypothetical protein
LSKGCCHFLSQLLIPALTPTSQPEPRNPFYFLLLLSGLLFVITALAIAVLPVLEDKARQAGAEVPPSGFRKALRSSAGLWWLSGEAVAIVVFSLLSMGLDRLRTLRAQRSAAIINLAADVRDGPDPEQEGLKPK